MTSGSCRLPAHYREPLEGEAASRGWLHQEEIFAKFLREHGYTTKDRFTLHTLGGRVTCVLEHEAGRVTQIAVDMGRARFDDFDSIEVDGKRIAVSSVSVGNPHCVVIVPDLSKVDVRGLGPRSTITKRSRMARTCNSRRSFHATR